MDSTYFNQPDSSASGAFRENFFTVKTKEELKNDYESFFDAPEEPVVTPKTTKKQVELGKAEAKSEKKL